MAVKVMTAMRIQAARHDVPSTSARPPAVTTPKPLPEFTID